MLEAADENALSSPAWWNGHVVAVERRRFDISVLRVQPDRPLPYLPGSRWPWRCRPGCGTGATTRWRTPRGPTRPSTSTSGWWTAGR